MQGTEVHWTWGPLGYLHLPQPIGAIAKSPPYFIVLSHVVAVLLLLRLTYVIKSMTLALWTVLIVAAGCLLNPFSFQDRLEVPVLLAALLVVIDKSQWRYLELVLLGQLAALGLLGKFNVGCQSFALFLTAVAIFVYQDHPLSRSKRWALGGSLLLFLLTLFAVYRTATGEILSIGAYFRTCLEIASGYSESMAVVAPEWQIHLAILSVVALFAAIPLLTARPRLLLPGILLAAVVVFFAWKNATVRQVRYTRSFNPTMALASLYLVVHAAAGRDRRLIMAYQLASLYMGYQLIAAEFPGQRDYVVRSRLSLQHAGIQAQRLFAWKRTRDQIAKQSATNLSVLRLDSRFHEAIGQSAVDAVPWNMARVYANQWNWRPRPIIQSYSAYTPSLDALNANHLLSTDAAEHVLLEWGPIDQRHHFFADPMSWRALLDRYDFIFQNDQVALLRRGDPGRFKEDIALGATRSTWGEPIIVPDEEGWVILSVTIEKSLWGVVRAIFFRLEPTYVEVSYRSGKTRQWRAVAESLESGVIINPSPSTFHELASMFRSADMQVAEEVVSIRLLTSDPDQFEADIPVRWSRITTSRP